MLFLEITDIGLVLQCETNVVQTVDQAVFSLWLHVKPMTFTVRQHHRFGFQIDAEHKRIVFLH